MGNTGCDPVIGAENAHDQAPIGEIPQYQQSDANEK
jgi:hypothetical protein